MTPFELLSSDRDTMAHRLLGISREFVLPAKVESASGGAMGAMGAPAGAPVGPLNRRAIEEWAAQADKRATSWLAGTRAALIAAGMASACSMPPPDVVSAACASGSFLNVRKAIGNMKAPFETCGAVDTYATACKVVLHCYRGGASPITV